MRLFRSINANPNRSLTPSKQGTSTSPRSLNWTAIGGIAAVVAIPIMIFIWAVPAPYTRQKPKHPTDLSAQVNVTHPVVTKNITPPPRKKASKNMPAPKTILSNMPPQKLDELDAAQTARILHKLTEFKRLLAEYYDLTGREDRTQSDTTRMNLLQKELGYRFSHGIYDDLLLADEDIHVPLGRNIYDRNCQDDSTINAIEQAIWNYQSHLEDLTTTEKH